MGLFIVSKKEGTSSEKELQEFKQDIMNIKHLAIKVCEKVEDMEDEYGSSMSERTGYRDGGSYRDGYRSGYREGYDEAEFRRGRR